MKRVIWSVLLTVVLLAGLGIGFSTSVSATPVSAVGAVYSMTNDPAGNRVVIFDRAANGTLTLAGSVLTGGNGMGSAIDPLGSQGSLALTEDGRWLLACNAGTNDITVFLVLPHGLLKFDKVSSGGTMPVSLAVSSATGRVWVLNTGGSPNITSFGLNQLGHLYPAASSTISLGAGAYAEVHFSQNPYGLVVTDKAGSRILFYPLTGRGIPMPGPVITASNGTTPFGFIFDNQNHLLVVEVRSGTNGAVSSYQFMPNGHFQVISGSVANGQSAACWIAGNAQGYVYTTNPGSATISSYTDSNGTVSLLNATAATGVTPIDVGITPNGNYLYALDPPSGKIDAFSIAPNGSLTSIGAVSGGFAIYAQGVAVR